MKYKVDMNKEVRKFLHSHPEVSAKFISALEQIAQNPFDNALDIKKLQGEEHKYRLRIGKYRTTYTNAMNVLNTLFTPIELKLCSIGVNYNLHFSVRIPRPYLLPIRANL